MTEEEEDESMFQGEGLHDKRFTGILPVHCLQKPPDFLFVQ